MTNTQGSSGGSGPAAAGVVAAVVAVEAAVAGGYGVVLAVDTLTQPATERVAAAFLALSAVVLAAGLVVAARAVRARRRAARAPVLVWQLLQLSVAVPALGTRWYVGVPLTLLAVVAGLGVLRSDVFPESSSHLGDDGTEPADDRREPGPPAG